METEAHSRTGAEASPAAAWVWDTRDPDRVVARARSLGVRELFVSVGADPPAELPALRHLVSHAAEHGIVTAALGSATEWTLDHGSALRWRDAVLATGIFASLHLDVEPHVPHEWPGGLRWPDPRLVAGYVGLLDALARSGPAPEVDVPSWWHTVAGASEATLADDVVTRAGAVTVMAYRGSASGLWAASRDMLARADAAGARRVRIAASALPVPGCPDCGFTRAAALRAALDAVARRARRHPSFAGVAVHDLEGWATLR